jgi:hypothetical protein
MKISIVAGFGVAVASLAMLPPVQGREMPGGDFYVKETTAQPGCPAAVLHILRSGQTLSGVVFFKDGSGTSSVSGTTDGTKVNFTMTPMSGNGPKGDVTGQVSPQGSLQLQLVGTNCKLKTMVPVYSGGQR